MIKVKKTVTCPAHSGGITGIYKSYLSHSGLSLCQTKLIQKECDYSEPPLIRISHDNGKTYGEWEQVKKENYITLYDKDEYWKVSYPYKVWNPVYNHYVQCYMIRYAINGHVEAYQKWWNNGGVGVNNNGELQGFFDHEYISVLDENDNLLSDQMIKYESGEEFNSKDPRNLNYLLKKRFYIFIF